MKNSLIFTILSAICAIQPCYVGAMKDSSPVERFNAIVELLGNDPKRFEKNCFSLEYIGLDKGLVTIARGFAQARLSNNELELLKHENDAQLIETIKIEVPDIGYADYHVEAAAKLFGDDPQQFERKNFLLNYIGFDKRLIRDAKQEAEFTLRPIEKEFVIDGPVPKTKQEKNVEPQKTPEKKEAPKKQSFWKRFLNNYSRELTYVVPITFGVVGALGLSWFFSRR